jgi:NAD(P)-dependent dehydrogenase (short-subunit alcohol dehydrogenase family)
VTTEQFSLTGKVALVTGGNGGLGKAMAIALRQAGAAVAVTGRNPDKNAAVASELRDALVLPLDVRDEAAVERTVAAVLQRLGRLDVLVNNAGQSRGGAVLELRLEDWRAVIDSHLTGAFLCAKHAARAMVAAGDGGKIINIASPTLATGRPTSPTTPPPRPACSASPTPWRWSWRPIGSRSTRSCRAGSRPT